MRKYISFILSFLCVLVMTIVVSAEEAALAPATNDTFSMIIGLLCISAAVLVFFIVTAIIIKSKKKK